MTVTNTDRKVRATGNGISVDFAFSFPVKSSSDIKVYKIDTSVDPEVPTLQTITTDYSVSLNAVTEGGTVTYVTAPTSDQDSFIIRVMDYTQPTPLSTNDDFDEEAIEDAIDKSRMLEIQNNEAIDRCVKLDEYYSGSADATLPIPEASTIIGWDSTGLVMANYTSSDIDQALVTSFGEDLVTSADASTARDFLELGTADDVEFNDVTINGDLTFAEVNSFKATRAGAQVISNSTLTKIQFNTESYDSNSEYDNVTNFRFTPKRSGKYLITSNIRWQSTAGGAERRIEIYKNGVSFHSAAFQRMSGIATDSPISVPVELNGTTDYIEIYGFQDSGGNLSVLSGGWFSGNYLNK